MHPGRAGGAGVTFGGRADIRAHPGADQPGSRTGHERVAKEQELIMPNDVRFTAAATLRRSPSRRLFEFIASPRQRLIHSAPDGPSSVWESRTHGSAREA